ncbi:MAG TPA: hypothetical protein VEX64_05815 [Pyrinomonadaceae bacterium]|jgi:hypothetical protein|nr:hypothetical protein [Pyrinomonadaceae bacterium]
MALKIENNSSIKLPKDTESHLEKITQGVPRDHLRGLERIRLVDFINDPRLKNANLPQKNDLPGLYHPRQGTQPAWVEIAVGALLKPHESYMNRLMPKMSFKANLATVMFSLIGQHYYLTFRHSVKRTQIEGQVRQYAEKYLRAWSEKQAEGSWRAKVFKPFRPILERWAKSLNKRAAASQKKTVKS